MIELYRPEDCPVSDKFETALKEMVIAHKIIVVEPDQIENDTSVPALKDNGQVITGEEAIESHLKKLAQFIYEWNTYQGDACYINDEGETC